MDEFERTKKAWVDAVFNGSHEERQAAQEAQRRALDAAVVDEDLLIDVTVA